MFGSDDQALPHSAPPGEATERASERGRPGADRQHRRQQREVEEVDFTIDGVEALTATTLVPLLNVPARVSPVLIHARDQQTVTIQERHGQDGTFQTEYCTCKTHVTMNELKVLES